VRSYFGETSARRPPKLRRLLAEIKRLEWCECGSELEALLLERRLIAERLPILNRQHKRFEVYPYLVLSHDEFPRLTVTRAEPISSAECGMRSAEWEAPNSAPIERAKWEADSALRTSHSALETAPRAGEIAGLYLGPFTSPRAATWTFEAMRAIFPLRSCEDLIQIDAQGRSCFYHEIKRCAGPCVGAISQEKYAAICADLLQLLRSGNAPQLDALRVKMQALSQDWKFEEAAQVKEQLDAIEAVARRLQRLERMRRDNNVVIVQSGQRDENGESGIALFLVQGGIVRRHLAMREIDEKTIRAALREVYDAPPPVADYTAKTELDEMMILDRWLKTHRSEPCCLWVGARNRQWTSNIVRGVRAWKTQKSTPQ